MGKIEKTVCIIKPEGMSKRREIFQILEVHLCCTFRSFEIVLPSWFVKDLYRGKIAKQIWPIMENTLLQFPSEIFVLEGDSVVERLFSICGEDTDPQKCKEGTIRRNFFASLDSISTPGGVYYRNGVHRAKPDEVAEDLALVERLHQEFREVRKQNNQNTRS